MAAAFHLNHQTQGSSYAYKNSLSSVMDLPPDTDSPSPHPVDVATIFLPPGSEGMKTFFLQSTGIGSDG